MAIEYDARVFDARRAIEFEITLRKRQHASMVRRRQVEGKWDDVVWSYRGANILFVALRAADGNLSNNRMVSHRRPLEGMSAQIARCIAIRSMEQGRAPETVLNHIISFRILDEQMGSSFETWAHLTKRDIANAASLIDSMPWSASSKYSRHCHLKLIVAYFNNIFHVKGKRAYRFLPVRINWHHKKKNPVRSWLEEHGERAGFGGRGTIPEGLEKAVAELHHATRVHPDAEPKPGFDSVRVNSLPFKLGMGLRIGEVVTLSLACLDVEQITGSPFLRVWTEKGQLPTARPVSLVWYPIIRESIEEITRVTRPARDRARQIEESGFQFIDRDLAEYRKTHPLTRADRTAIKAAGYSPGDVAWPHEIEAVFNEPGTAFTLGRKYAAASQVVAPLNIAAVVAWLDERIAKWDWAEKQKTKPRNNFALSRWLVLREVAREAGVSIAELKRFKEATPLLTPFIRSLDRARVRPGVVPPDGEIGRKLRADTQSKWDALRRRLLAVKRRRCHRIWVDLQKWKKLLEARYLTVLKRHMGTQDVSHFVGGTSTASSASRAIYPGRDGQRLSEQLFVVWEHTFNGATAFTGVLPYPVENHDIYSYLCTNSVKKTAFKRFGILAEDGEPFSVGPHQIRHWLTNAMLRSGPSEMLVDLWMGRTPGQSRMYDHRTARERADAARDRYLTQEPPEDYLGRCVTQWRKDDVPRAEIAALVSARLQVLHLTPYGGCARELTIMPCQRALACVRGYGTTRGCSHFIVNFSDQEARANLEQLRQKYERVLHALEPRYPQLRDNFMAELNTTESLDQHLAFLHEMVQGIRTVLHEYKLREGEGARHD